DRNVTGVQTCALPIYFSSINVFSISGVAKNKVVANGCNFSLHMPSANITNGNEALDIVGSNNKIYFNGSNDSLGIRTHAGDSSNTISGIFTGFSGNAIRLYSDNTLVSQSIFDDDTQITDSGTGNLIASCIPSTINT